MNKGEKETPPKSYHINNNNIIINLKRKELQIDNLISQQIKSEKSKDIILIAFIFRFWLPSRFKTLKKLAKIKEKI